MLYFLFCMSLFFNKPKNTKKYYLQVYYFYAPVLLKKTVNIRTFIVRWSTLYKIFISDNYIPESDVEHHKGEWQFFLKKFRLYTTLTCFLLFLVKSSRSGHLPFVLKEAADLNYVVNSCYLLVL